MQKPFVITVSNRKGGTGKTTTAVNIAAEFALRGIRTLLIDMDTQGHGALGVGLHNIPRKALSVHHLFGNHENFKLTDAIMETPFDNLSFIPADRMFEGIGVERDLKILSRELENPELMERFDFVVLDTPPSLDIILMNAIAAADGVLIPLVPHFLASEGVKQLSRLFYKIASTVNPSLKLLGVVPIMVNRTVNMHKHVLNEMTLQFGSDRIFRGIRTDIQLAQAFLEGQPIQHFAPKTRGALDYHILADEVINLWQMRFFS